MTLDNDNATTQAERQRLRYDTQDNNDMVTTQDNDNATTMQDNKHATTMQDNYEVTTMHDSMRWNSGHEHLSYPNCPTPPPFTHPSVSGMSPDTSKLWFLLFPTGPHHRPDVSLMPHFVSEPRHIEHIAVSMRDRTRLCKE